MTETVRYRCNQCGERFEVQVLTDRERREAREQHRQVYAIHCPKCGSRDVRRQ